MMNNELYMSDERFFSASLGTRFLAALIDSMLACGIWLAALLLSKISGGLYFITLSLGYIILFIIQINLLSSYGQSIGKKIMKIKIVRSDSGENGGFVTNVMLREVVNGLLCMIPFYILIDVLFIFSEDKRCLHDKIAGTIVIEA